MRVTYAIQRNTYKDRTIEGEAMKPTAQDIKKLERKISQLPAIEYSHMEMWEVEEIENREAKLREQLKQMKLDAGMYGENNE
jgi:cell fate (sporulation/competence/biofilm development) regulator YmcA (YheA/YmcA/DUF963 family)|tara:strand:+ start:753 stop:998 length:246 start_codon:yes stop_codon:yes gene_type:complete